MKTEQKIELQANKLLGQFIGTVGGILYWDIPDKLKVKLQAQLEELNKVKIISSNGDVSGNEANPKENKKDGEVAVAFADWIAKQSPEIRLKRDNKWYDSGAHRIMGQPVFGEEKLIGTTTELYHKFLLAKATDR